MFLIQFRAGVDSGMKDNDRGNYRLLTSEDSVDAPD